MSLTPASQERTIIAHGFSPDEIAQLEGLLRHDDHQPLVFAATLDRHLKLALQDLVRSVHREADSGALATSASSDQPARIPGRENQRVLYLHGFDKQELFGLVDLVKKNVANPKGIAFATSTTNNLSMPLARLVWEVWRDHDYMEARRQAQREGRPLPPPPED